MSKDLAADATVRRSRWRLRPETRQRKSAMTLAAVVLLVCVFVVAAPAQTKPPAYLAEMPSTQRVLTKIKGKDQLDTWARQYATFERLGAIMGDLEGPREFNPTPSEARVASDYRQQLGLLQARAIGSVSSSNQPALRRTWFPLAWGYESDKKFNRQLMATFFSPSFQARYDDAVRNAAKQRILDKAKATRTITEPTDDGDQTNSPWLWVGGVAAFVLFTSLIAFSRAHAIRNGWFWWSRDGW